MGFSRRGLRRMKSVRKEMFNGLGLAWTVHESVERLSWLAIEYRLRSRVLRNVRGVWNILNTGIKKDD